jgi:uncharacterized protein with PQ loop repeat
MLTVVVIGVVFSVLGTVLTLISIYHTKQPPHVCLVFAWLGWTAGNVFWIFYGLMVPGDGWLGVAFTGATGTLLNLVVFGWLLYRYCQSRCGGSVRPNSDKYDELAIVASSSHTLPNSA